MLFNSNEFLIFVCVVSILYFLLARDVRLQNVLIVIASFVFYGSWSLPFLLLMIFTGTVDYVFGRLIHSSRNKFQKKTILIGSLFVNLGILGYFKYGGFGAEILQDLFSVFHGEIQRSVWTVMLPVGISFYTFQSISYVIDVYRGHISAERNWVTFMAFLTFFPQLVAGPIERAGHLLPQFKEQRSITASDIDQVTWLLLWGFFKKVVIADNLAPYSDLVFSKDSYPLTTYLFGTLAFGIQIYCDFSGYSDIARGLGKFFGFDIMFNFRLPYAATNLRDFWTRWHSSLSGWFRDYLYIPLGGNRRTLAITCRNLFIVMLVAGLWHGANWTFVIWGVWHGAALIVCVLWRKSEVRLPSILAWSLTMAVVFVGWLFFRATSLQQLYAMLFENRDALHPLWIRDYLRGLLIFIAPLAAIETIQLIRHDLTWPTLLPFVPKSILYGFIFAAVLLYWENEGTSFIYFQF